MTSDGRDLDYAERMLRVRSFIESNLDESIEVEALASLANFSPYHFQRVFRGFVGESVGAHIRRLRLERAATRLRFGERPISDIALTSGYTSHEAFTRAFTQAFGMTPRVYRGTLRA